MHIKIFINIDRSLWVVSDKKRFGQAKRGCTVPTWTWKKNFFSLMFGHQRVCNMMTMEAFSWNTSTKFSEYKLVPENLHFVRHQDVVRSTNWVCNWCYHFSLGLWPPPSHLHAYLQEEDLVCTVKPLVGSQQPRQLLPWKLPLFHTTGVYSRQSNWVENEWAPH